jgi:hypothetical protein
VLVGKLDTHVVYDTIVIADSFYRTTLFGRTRGMMKHERPSYTLDELRSYLPSGWDLADGGEVTWDDRKQRLSFRVIDNVDFDWPVKVSSDDVARLGRLQALEKAFDDVYRGRLGKGTRGLGLA